MSKNIVVPIGVNYKSKATIVKKDAKTKKVKEKRETHNLLLNYWLDRFFSNNPEGLGANMNDCYLGTSDTSASRDDNGILGTTLGENDKISESSSSQGDYPVWEKAVYTFYADTANGTIWEIGIGNDGSLATARIVLDSALEKTSDDELEITYERYLYREQDSWSDTLTGGGIDGEDIDWTAMINDEQMHIVKNGGLCMGKEDGESYPIKLGDDNTDSSLSDPKDNLKGDVIKMDSTYDLTTVKDWTTGQTYRETEYGFETDVANDNIREVLLYTLERRSYSDNFEPIARVTFDPALSKNSDYRLYLTFRTSLSSW